ncbi:hypothetical protein ACIP5L_01445 [Streptomyces bacillaris]|uniref:hypothetical protein n=1 Tax=Streptomyces bacillaris TaxID=68179 RepID=UPI00382BEF8C
MLTEVWGDLSFAAGQYVITTTDRTVAVGLFPADAAEEAFTGLLQDCDQRPTRA